ncbi:Glycosyl transferase, family 1 [Dillenia turbinata]|uniref:Glycosyl transferase, family 1 n=1 Tax=Dillenia turbinata TaxID=194707 RepID=A0AAN8YTR8_9MAGN
MEEGNDLNGNLVRQSLLRPLKSSLSGKSSPRSSPSFRRLHSSRTPRREGRISSGGSQWLRSNRLLVWLLLITLWAYLGFYVQSKWAHSERKEGYFGLTSRHDSSVPESDENQESAPNQTGLKVKTGSGGGNEVGGDKIPRINVSLAKKKDSDSSKRSGSARRKGKRPTRSLRSKVRGKQKAVQVTNDDEDGQVQDIPRRNTSFGLLLGPFGRTEDKILEWSIEKRSGTCERKGEFARLVWSRRFVLIFHELSMTGAPLAMMELASELISCGAAVSTVVLSKRGGLMPELARRRIKVLEDKAELSIKTAMKADLIIAGSAVCASWIERYMEHFRPGSGQIAWWIMENRREYFNRSKSVLGDVKKLIFISESQSKQWLSWCEEEKIKLKTEPGLVPLSVNDELAFVAGIACSLNTPSFSVEKMLEKRQLLRNAVRREMGLTDNDVLVLTLSSINPGKGQLLLLESVRLMMIEGHSTNDSIIDGAMKFEEDYGAHHSRALFQYRDRTTESLIELDLSNESSANLNGSDYIRSKLPGLMITEKDTDVVSLNSSHKARELLSKDEAIPKQALKVLIGSVGSKSNKIPYVKAILTFLSQHSNLSNLILWTPATTNVASLYSAADVYVINSQGVGETFGRVTIEAMAYGLPVLGTDAGGTKEIVEHNVTGLLHPVGRPGTQVLAQSLQFLLENQSVRKEMGKRGRKKVEKMYLKRHMYKKFAEVLFSCMRIKMNNHINSL